MRDSYLELADPAGGSRTVYLERCELGLPDPDGAQCWIRRQAQGYRVEAAPGGELRVNGRPVREARLIDGDRIELDGLQCTFHAREPAAPVRLVEGGEPLDERFLVRSTQTLRRGLGEGELSIRMLLLFRIWDMLHVGRSPREVAGQLLEILFQTLPLRRGVVALRTPSGGFDPIAARNEDDPRAEIALPAAVLEAVARHRRATLAPAPGAGSEVLSVICVPILVQHELYGVVYADNHARLRSFSREDLEYCSLIAELAALTIENSKLQEQELVKLNQQLHARQRKLERDLALARQVQVSLVPEPLVEGRVQVAVRYQPMSEVGGDLLLLEPARRERIFVGLCDVSGHGMAAALMASRIAGEARLRARRGQPLEEMLAGLNSMLLEAYGPMGLFATLVAGFLDFSEGTFLCCGAGHVPLIRVRGSEALLLPSRNMPLGMLADCLAADPVARLDLVPGDVLLLYSDGFVESRGAGGRFLGADALQRKLVELAAGGRSAEEIADDLLAFEAAHREGELLDDLSLAIVVIR